MGPTVAVLGGRAHLPPGTLIADSFRVSRVVGAAGFGVTYEAEEIHLGRKVELNEYFPEDLAIRLDGLHIRPKSGKHAIRFEKGRKGFLREANTLAKFRHANIVKVSRVFEANSTAYVALEFEQRPPLEASLPPQREDQRAHPLVDAMRRAWVGTISVRRQLAAGRGALLRALLVCAACLAVVSVLNVFAYTRWTVARSQSIAEVHTGAAIQAEADRGVRVDQAKRLRVAALEQEQIRQEQQRAWVAQRRLPVRARDPVAELVPGSAAGARDDRADGGPCPTCPEMVVVPKGTFTMGSPPTEFGRDKDEALVQVVIGTAFAVGRFAITFDEWDACAAAGGCNGYRPDDQGWGRGTQPVINVSWDDAKAYVAWLSLRTGKSYRLLTEAEREYVTRAGSTTAFWWGASITPAQANYNGSFPYGDGSKGEYRQRTIAVNSFGPNPWGLYNVHGNVGEWTEDCWNDSNNGNTGDGRARASGACGRRVVRGGRWNTGPQFHRSAFRDWAYASKRSNVQGFRVARTIAP